MEQPQENYFETLAKINVNDHVEKKNQFSYLSWAYAVDVLRKAEPSATWEVLRFNGVPFMKTECGYFVEVAVTVQGVTLSQIHPVLDNYNKPIQQPNAFQINTSIQRCLVKAIALHGLGLYIYAGEDLPDDDGNGASKPPSQPRQQSQAPTTPTHTQQAPSAPQSAPSTSLDDKKCYALMRQLGWSFDDLQKFASDVLQKEIRNMKNQISPEMWVQVHENLVYFQKHGTLIPA